MLVTEEALVTVRAYDAVVPDTESVGYKVDSKVSMGVTSTGAIRFIGSAFPTSACPPLANTVIIRVRAMIVFTLLDNFYGPFVTLFLKKIKNEILLAYIFCYLQKFIHVIVGADGNHHLFRFVV